MLSDYQLPLQSKQPHNCLQCGRLISSNTSTCQECSQTKVQKNQSLPLIAKLFIGINFIIGVILILIA